MNRFSKTSEPKSLDECWVWKGHKDKEGYGKGNPHKEINMLAHRISFYLFHGRVGVGKVVDHICKNRSCVNPFHLRQVTQYVNAVENSVSPVAQNKSKTHCKYGHELVLRKKLESGRTWRKCPKCDRASSRRFYAKHGRKKSCKN